MSPGTRKALLGLGILSALLLLWLRFESQGMLLGNLGVFFELLGYDGEKSYALFLFDPQYEPDLITSNIVQGKITIESVIPAAAILKGIPKHEFSDQATSLLDKIRESSDIETVDAVAFITTDGAIEIIDALGGISLDGELMDGPGFVKNIRDSSRLGTISLSKARLVKRSSLLLETAKKIASEEEFGLYFAKKIFDKSCFGSCGARFNEYAK